MCCHARCCTGRQASRFNETREGESGLTGWSAVPVIEAFGELRHREMLSPNPGTAWEYVVADPMLSVCSSSPTALRRWGRGSFQVDNALQVSDPGTSSPESAPAMSSFPISLAWGTSNIIQSFCQNEHHPPLVWYNHATW